MVEKLTRKHPETDQPRNYYTIHYLSLIALAGHFVFFLVMLVAGQIGIAVFNIGSCILYLTCFLINRRLMHRTAMFLATIEVVGHAWYSVIVLGWQSGFHIYVLCLVPLFLLFEGPRIATKVIITIMLYASLVGLAIVTSADRIFFSSMNYLFSFIVLSALAYYYGKASRNAEQSLKKANDILEKQSRTDALTSLSNRRDAMERIRTEASRVERLGGTFCIALADMDDFKDVNDNYGHESGDMLLKQVAELMRSHLRPYDFVARWGGEEFVFIFPNSSIEQGVSAAENIRTAIESESFEYHGTVIRATLTLGVSCYSRGSNIDERMRAADDAMYRGKANGKNRAVQAL